jgi:hypothetical protein
MYSVERLRAVLAENTDGIDDCIDASQFRQPRGYVEVTRKVCIDRSG